VNQMLGEKGGVCKVLGVRIKMREAINTTLPEGLWLLSDRGLPAIASSGEAGGSRDRAKTNKHSVNPARNASQREAGGSGSSSD
jgi:hypothetical protein